MKMYMFLLAGYMLLSVSGRSQAPTSADAVLNDAISVAATGKKTVLIIFHASWCGWCHKMDTAMNDNSVKKFFTDNYVIRHLLLFE